MSKNLRRELLKQIERWKWCAKCLVKEYGTLSSVDTLQNCAEDIEYILAETKRAK